MSKKKYKKQFRLYDVYRYATTQEMSLIENITSYEVNRDASVLRVRFFGDPVSSRYTAKNEDELKEVIRTINRKLGNCCKPGPKRRKHR